MGRIHCVYAPISYIQITLLLKNNIIKTSSENYKNGGCMIPEKVLKHANQKGTSKTYRKMYLRAWEQSDSGRHSFVDIIKAKCVECVGFEQVSISVTKCTVEICPIHQVRMNYFSLQTNVDPTGADET